MDEVLEILASLSTDEIVLFCFKTENYFFQDLVESPEGVLIYSTHKEAEEGPIACIVGELNYEEEKYNAYRFFESRDKTKYYQVSFHNQCGAGPCSRFGKIRLL